MTKLQRRIFKQERRVKRAINRSKEVYSPEAKALWAKRLKKADRLFIELLARGQ